jgi:hypothetical protein
MNKEQALAGTPLNSHQQTNVPALLVSCASAPVQGSSGVQNELPAWRGI